MCFAVARMAGWLPGDRGRHVTFGNVLGSDRKMFRSRSGDTVKLTDLLGEAVERAAAALAERNPEAPSDEGSDVARTVGIGAVKYADLSTDRARDYVFDWDRMLAFEGTPAPYLQYAHARVHSIFRRAGGAVPPPGTPIVLDQPAERALGLALLGYGEAVDATVASWSPSRLCAYLFSVATAYTTFYETCPVLQAPEDTVRHSRLALSALTSRILAHGLGILGITAPERM